MASDTAPHREVITTGQTGLLIDGGDIGRDEEQALAVVADPAGHRPLGDAAVDLVRERYAQDVCLPRLAERFSTLVAAAGKDRERPVYPRRVPAQFGRLGLELTERHGWRCEFLVQSLSSCPTPSREMLQKLEIHKMPLTAEHRSERRHSLAADLTDTISINARLSMMRSKQGAGLAPDLIVAHGGRGAPRLFLREVVDCPIVIYCEYYFANSHRDISIASTCRRPSRRPFFPRCINAPTLVTLVDCDAGYSATQWQKSSFPDRFHSKIDVHFDGIDTDLYHPGPAPRRFGDSIDSQSTRVLSHLCHAAWNRSEVLTSS